MTTDQEHTTEKLGLFPNVIGGMSFIPLLGIPFAITSIVWGSLTKKVGGKRLVIMGALGIASTVAIYGSLYYFSFVQRGGVYDDLRLKLAQSTLNSAVPIIEMYKVSHGQYPETLKEVQDAQPKESFAFLFDPSMTTNSKEPQYFFYQRVNNDHYYLRSVGPDGKPFTADDLVPQVQIDSKSRVGLLLQPVKQ